MKDDACGVGVVATPAPSNDKHLSPFYLATSTLKQERGGGTLDSLSINRHCCSCCCAPKNNRPPLSSPRFHLPLTRSYCCHCFSLGLVSFRETSHLSNIEGVLVLSRLLRVRPLVRRGDFQAGSRCLFELKTSQSSSTFPLHILRDNTRN